MVEPSPHAPSARTADHGESEAQPRLEQLGGAFAAVGSLVANVRPEQWSAPTPCTQWSVRQLVNHLIGMNRVFVALLRHETPPRPGTDDPEVDPVDAFARSAADLLAAFSRPGVLEEEFRSPLGVATGAERLQIRLYDLLTHGWDLARATGQSAELLSDDAAEQSLTFVRVQLAEQARPGRFGPAQPIADRAPAIERLAAFLGRPVRGLDHAADPS